MAEQALHHLKNPSPPAYSRALAALSDDTRGCWEEQLGWKAHDQKPYKADAENLRRFPGNRKGEHRHVMPWVVDRRIIKRWEHEDVFDRMQDQLDRMP